LRICGTACILMRWDLSSPIFASTVQPEGRPGDDDPGDTRIFA
jgi:hypothetical protein